MKIFNFFISIFSLVFLIFNASAQTSNWPSKPITLVVPFAAGGSTDITARMLAEKLTVKQVQQATLLEPMYLELLPMVTRLC